MNRTVHATELLGPEAVVAARSLIAPHARVWRCPDCARAYFPVVPRSDIAPSNDDDPLEIVCLCGRSERIRYREATIIYSCRPHLPQGVSVPILLERP